MFSETRQRPNSIAHRQTSYSHHLARNAISKSGQRKRVAAPRIRVAQPEMRDDREGHRRDVDEFIIDAVGSAGAAGESGGGARMGAGRADRYAARHHHGRAEPGAARRDRDGLVPGAPAVEDPGHRHHRSLRVSRAAARRLHDHRHDAVVQGLHQDGHGPARRHRRAGRDPGAGQRVRNGAGGRHRAAAARHADRRAEYQA